MAADPQIAGYKSSTLLRALCLFGIGYQASLMLQANMASIEGIVFMIVYVFGLFVSKAKDGTQLKVFAAISVLVGALRTFFQWDGYSSIRAGSNAVKAGTLGNITFTGFEKVSALDWIQLLISVATAYFAFTISK